MVVPAVPAVAQAAPPSPQGRSLYYQVCALCHGQSAEGGGPVPNLKEFQGTAERFITISLNGRPDKGMPPWKGKLSEDEIQAIFAFIQSLSTAQ
jgi:cytochrome c oxidase cbb3-type subunit 3